MSITAQEMAAHLPEHTPEPDRHPLNSQSTCDTTNSKCPWQSRAESSVFAVSLAPVDLATDAAEAAAAFEGQQTELTNMDLGLPSNMDEAPQPAVPSLHPCSSAPAPATWAPSEPMTPAGMCDLTPWLDDPAHLVSSSPPLYSRSSSQPSGRRGRPPPVFSLDGSRDHSPALSRSTTPMRGGNDQSPRETGLQPRAPARAHSVLTGFNSISPSRVTVAQSPGTSPRSGDQSLMPSRSLTPPRSGDQPLMPSRSLTPPRSGDQPLMPSRSLTPPRSGDQPLMPSRSLTPPRSGDQPLMPSRSLTPTKRGQQQPPSIQIPLTAPNSAHALLPSCPQPPPKPAPKAMRTPTPRSQVGGMGSAPVEDASLSYNKRPGPGETAHPARPTSLPPPSVYGEPGQGPKHYPSPPPSMSGEPGHRPMRPSSAPTRQTALSPPGQRTHVETCSSMLPAITSRSSPPPPLHVLPSFQRAASIQPRLKDSAADSASRSSPPSLRVIPALQRAASIQLRLKESAIGSGPSLVDQMIPSTPWRRAADHGF
eukprot:gene10551-12203_t